MDDARHGAGGFIHQTKVPQVPTPNQLPRVQYTMSEAVFALYPISTPHRLHARQLALSERQLGHVITGNGVRKMDGRTDALRAYTRNKVVSNAER